MKPTHLSITILCVFSFFIIGCSHTNELAKYRLTGLRYVSESSVESGAANVDISFDQMSAGSNPVTGILVAIGEGITTAEATNKLERAVKPAGVAASIAHGFERDLIRYLEVQRGASGDSIPDLIVNTHLEELKFHSGSSGVFVKIKAQTTIIDRASAAIVWQNREETEMPIRNSGNATGVPILGTIVGIVNAAEFFKLSEKEIQDIVLSSAEDVGYLMGETLREDAAKTKK